MQAPRALLFGSGYLANLAVVQALMHEGDLCVQDKLNHASLIDAARLAGCAFKRYPHGDAEGAARQLASQGEGAAVLAGASDVGPHELAERVERPGGTTRAGLAVLDAEDRLARLVRDTFDATVRREQEMRDEARAAGPAA